MSVLFCSKHLLIQYCQFCIKLIPLFFLELYTNIITFRKTDATVEFPTFDAAASGDIRFQFMTTAMNGIFLQNTGQYDFIEVRLVCKCF